MSIENIDVMESLTSDVITITRRYLAMYHEDEDDPGYREDEDDPERILTRYSESIRELLDAAMLGAGQLAAVEKEMALTA